MTITLEQVPVDTTPWYVDHGEMLAFAHALHARGDFVDVEAALHYIEKPWKWDADHDLWVFCGRPTDYTMPGFAEFMKGPQ